MRATLHLVSAGLLGLTTFGCVQVAIEHYEKFGSPDAAIGFAIVFALTAIANLIYAFKD